MLADLCGAGKTLELFQVFTERLDDDLMLAEKLIDQKSDLSFSEPYDNCKRAFVLIARGAQRTC